MLSGLLKNLVPPSAAEIQFLSKFNFSHDHINLWYFCCWQQFAPMSVTKPLFTFYSKTELNVLLSVFTLQDDDPILPWTSSHLYAPLA